MKTVIFLSSSHVETGKCNSLELYYLIEKIKPEVIFEELCNETFEAIYFKGYIPQSLEAKAVKAYIGNYVVKHFPVDTYDLDFSKLFKGASIIAKKNAEYLKLFKEKLALVNQFGHSFLNSQKCTEIIRKIHQIEKATLLEINDDQLRESYNLERELHDKREIEMLQNIYAYSENLNYSIALFICGAEHRDTIIQKLPDFQKNKKEKLNWTFSESKNPPPNTC